MTELKRKAGDRFIGTIYAGGGTPTVLKPSFWAEFLSELSDTADTSLINELTIETNPGTVALDELRMLRKLGFNRLSIGIQSFSEEELILLGRIHNPASAYETFSGAREAEFDNIGIDLIYGIPRQDQRSWRSSLLKALELFPEHISCYELSVEDGTPLAGSVDAGILSKPPEEVCDEMYFMADELLTKAGYVHYEVSNYARGEEHISLHNSSYWDRRSCIGLGPSAHSFDGGRIRTWNVDDIHVYLGRLEAGEDPMEESETLSVEDEVLEKLMLGLRMIEGVDLGELENGTGIFLNRDYLHLMEDSGKVYFKGSRIVPTARGMLFADGDSVNLMADNPHLID